MVLTSNSLRSLVPRASIGGKQLDASSSGREEAFRATVDSQWALLASQDDEDETQRLSLSAQGDGNGGNGVLPDTRETSASGASTSSSLLRSPFLVCGDRHPDAIRALESVIHRARTQLAYSRGNTACLLAGLRLDEIEAVRQSEGVHAIEPLPQTAKLSRNLHAKLDDPPEQSSGRDNERRDMKRDSGARQRRRAPLGNIRFDHSEGLPSDLDVSLTPGVWGLDMVHTWTDHLTSFETAAHLWDEHLRQRFLWTRRPTAVDEGEATIDHPVGGAGDNRRKERRGLADDGALPPSAPGVRRARNALVETHGLEDLERLWEQTAEHTSNEDGGCDFGRLRALSASEDGNTESNTKGFRGRHTPRRERGGANGRSGSSQRGSASTKGGSGDNNHDRVVLRGAGSLGITPQDNPHCLLTVLAYLVTRPEVAYLDELPQVFERNVEAAWITQSGEETTYSIWNEGIDGRSEVRDTGRRKDTLVLFGEYSKESIWQFSSRFSRLIRMGLDSSSCMVYV